MSTQPQTLRLFASLPTELQIQIFQYAAVCSNGWSVSNFLYFSITCHIADNNGHFKRPHIILGFLLHKALSNGFKDRSSLLCTSRLSRQIALEAWRKDIGTLRVNRSYILCEENIEDVKDVLLGWVDKLIGEIGARHKA